MTFDIIPESSGDDWDFMLFHTGVDRCSEIASGNFAPIRTNLARSSDIDGGKTGLNHHATAPYEAAGENPTYSKWLEVIGGEGYLLVVDIKENHGKGFELQLHLKEWNIEEVHIENDANPASGGFTDMTEHVHNEEMVTMHFQFINKKTGEAIPCNAVFKAVDWVDSSVVIQNQSSIEVTLPEGEWFFLNVNKEGHTFSSEKYKSDTALARDVRKIYISQVETGEHIVLEEIVFRENTTHLLPTSVNALEQLIQFMQEHPTAVVEIQGHVNAPGYENEGKVKRFSEKRAEQVKLYLVDAGIEGSRIKIKGMGNEFMIYENPQNYDQEKANRRVEVLILSL